MFPLSNKQNIRGTFAFAFVGGLLSSAAQDLIAKLNFASDAYFLQKSLRSFFVKVQTVAGVEVNTFIIERNAVAAFDNRSGTTSWS